VRDTVCNAGNHGQIFPGSACLSFRYRYVEEKVRRSDSIGISNSDTNFGRAAFVEMLMLLILMWGGGELRAEF
jgi:hypothetical protein